MTNEALKREIRRVADENGIAPPHWAKLRRALNGAGVKALKGNTWSGDIQVKRYCEKHRVFDAAPIGMTQAESNITRAEHLQPEVGTTSEYESSQTASGSTAAEIGLSPESMPSQSDQGLTGKEQVESYQKNASGTTSEARPAPVSGVTDEGESSDTGLNALVTEIVKRELSQLLQGVELMPVQKSGRGGGSAVVKKAFSIPSDVWEQVQRLGGIMSNHVTAALRIYLNLKRKPSEPEA